MTKAAKCTTAAMGLLLGSALLMFAAASPAWAADGGAQDFPLVAQYEDYDIPEDGMDDDLSLVYTATWAAGRIVTIDELSDLSYSYIYEVYSSNPSVIRVTDAGYHDQDIEALRPGTATIYDADTDEPVAIINVKAAKLTRVGSSTAKVALYKTKKLSVKSSLAKAGITWKSSKPAVATVNSKGKVAAKGAGKTVISAKATGGNTVKWMVTVPKVKGSKVKIAKVVAQTFTGKAKKPKLTIKYAGKKFKVGRDFTVAYSNNKNIGTARATIKFRGSFTGKATRTFKIVAPKVGKPKITYWFEGDAYSKIEFDGGTNCDGTELWIESPGIDTYDKHIKGTWGYGYCYKAKIGAKAWFYIRSYKKAGGQYFYSPWVKMTL